MEPIAAFFIARSADQHRMSAGRLDGPVEVARPSLWRRSGDALSRVGTALRARRLSGAQSAPRAQSAHRAQSAPRAQSAHRARNVRRAPSAQA